MKSPSIWENLKSLSWTKILETSLRNRNELGIKNEIQANYNNWLYKYFFYQYGATSPSKFTGETAYIPFYHKVP